MIVAAGGRTTSWGRSKTVESYDIAADTWTLGKALLPEKYWTYFVHHYTLWALGESPGMTYWYNVAEDQWVQETSVVMNGVPGDSNILMVPDDANKCS